VVAAVFAGSQEARVTALALIAAPFPDGTPRTWRDVTGGPAGRLLLALYGVAHTGLSPVWPQLGPRLWPMLPAPRLPQATLRDCMRHTILSYVGTAEACLRPDHTAALAAAGEAPALLLYGGRDTKAPPGRAAQYAALFRRSRTVVLPDAGHHVLVSPDAQRLVAGWLTGGLECATGWARVGARGGGATPAALPGVRCSR
jgi:pimeloyl-ACP methyl ester carboxylesterase